MHKRSMLVVFFVLMFLLSLFMINVSKVNAQTQVSVQPASQTLGQEGVPLPTSPFTINVTVQNIEDLYGWQIVLYYNSTILNTRPDLIAVPPESIFKGKDFFPVGPYIENDSRGTQILFSATLKGEQPGVTGSGVLCQVQFIGMVEGTSSLDLKITTDWGISTGLVDSNFDDISCEISNGELTVIGSEKLREPSAITINVDPSTVAVGSNVTITGTINQARVGANVTIYYRPVSGAPGTLATVPAKEFNATHCRYEYNWTTEELGEYELWAYWPGDADYNEATSTGVPPPVTVNKRTSTISLNAYPAKALVGSSVTINGTITTQKPTLPYANVTISYAWTKDAWITLATVRPGEDGFYTYTWKTDEGHTYYLKANWPGDEYSESAESTGLKVEITSQDIMPLFYIIAAIAIIAMATIGIYFTKIRKRHHTVDT